MLSQQQVSDTIISQLVFKQLKVDEPSNQTCFDCGGPHTQYASYPNGIFICGTCADLHRNVLKSKKLSVVKSIAMDVWNDEEMIMMAMGGNNRMRDHLSKFDLMGEGAKDIVSRLRSRAAEYYRVQLRAKCEGIPFDVQELTHDFARQLISDNELKTYEKDIPRELQNGYDPFAYPGVNDMTEAVTFAQDYFTSAATYAMEQSNQMNVSEKVKGVQDYLYDSTQTIRSSVYENAEYVKESASQSDVYKKAGENAQYAASSMSSFSNSFYNSASSYFASQMIEGNTTMDKLQWMDPKTAAQAAQFAGEQMKEKE